MGEEINDKIYIRRPKYARWQKPLYIPDENGNVTVNASAAQAGQRYALEGYTPPAGVAGKEAVKEMQRMMGGLTVDGVWGRRRALPVEE